MEDRARPWWQRRQRFLAYVALLIVPPIVATQIVYSDCVANEPADGDDSLCVLAFLVVPPVTVAGVLALCAVYEMVVRAALRKHAGGWGVTQPRWPRYWFEALCAVAAIAVGVVAVLALVRPWEEEPRQVPEYREVLAVIEANRETVLPLVSQTGRRWPAADATYADTKKRFTGSGNHRLGPLFRELQGRRGARDPERFGCLYWPMLADADDDVRDARTLVEKCWRVDRPNAPESSLTYASLME